MPSTSKKIVICGAGIAGMRAALPYVDHFAPAHNLESLQGLLRLVG